MAMADQDRGVGRTERWFHQLFDSRATCSRLNGGQEVWEKQERQLMRKSIKGS